MKIALFAASVLILMSCGAKEDKNRIKRARLNGTWLVAKANLMDRFMTDFKTLQHDSIGPNNLMLDFFQFDDNNNVWLDTGAQYAFKGTYQIDDSVITMKFNGAIPEIKLGSLDMIDTTRFRFYRDYHKGSDKLVYELYGSKLMRPADSSWRNTLPPNSSDSIIKQRLKDVLAYYTSYCIHISRYKTTYFKPQRINLPFNLYSGGVGLAAKAKWDPDFKAIMGSEENQEKANQILKKAFSSSDYEYPYRENLLAEYADCFVNLSKAIK